MTKLIPALIIMASSLIFFIFVLPGYDSIKELNEGITIREGILVDRESLIEKVNSLNREYQTNLVNVAKISSALPKDKKLPELISSIDAITAQSGNSLLSTKYSILDKTKDRKVNIVSVEARLSGTYEGFTSFLRLLEQNIRISDVKNLNVSPEGKDGNLLKINIDFDTYFLDEEE